MPVVTSVTATINMSWNNILIVWLKVEDLTSLRINVFNYYNLTIITKLAILSFNFLIKSIKCIYISTNIKFIYIKFLKFYSIYTQKYDIILFIPCRKPL